MIRALTIFVCFIILITAVPSLHAQPCTLPQTKTWIAVSNVTGYRDTLWFGFDTTATCGEDPALCEIYPAEPCGAPSTLFCVFWSSPCGPGPGAIVLWRYDFRVYVHPAKIDTHRISFQPGDSGYPLIFRWNRDAVRAICDSAVLRYFSGVFYRHRMDLSDSLVLTDEFVFQIQLFRYGQRLTPVRVNESESDRPAAFALFQNYPNPFNPSTVIKFQLPASGFVRLKVYDVLGREVATLLEGERLAGEHSVEWTPEGMPSGIYTYRLTTANATLAKKMLLLK